jgi:hypothetical protein
MTSVGEGAAITAEREMPILPAPLRGGEAFEDYHRRVVVEDQEFARLARSARAFGFEISASSSFGPAFFTFALATAVADGAAAIPISTGIDRDRHRRVVDHLWSAQSKTLPLDIRMLPFRFPGKEIVPPAAPNEELIRRVGVWHSAARRRDMLVTALCDDLRTSKLACRAFLAGDASRTEVLVSPGWWADRAFRISPTRSESIADGDVAPLYRGMVISAKRSEPKTPLPKALVDAVGLRAVSDNALRKWWIDYVNAEVAAGRQPSRKENHAAAVAAFAGQRQPAEKRVFALRAVSPTPEAWGLKGRRKKLGE